MSTSKSRYTALAQRFLKQHRLFDQIASEGRAGTRITSIRTIHLSANEPWSRLAQR